MRGVAIKSDLSYRLALVFPPRRVWPANGQPRSRLFYIAVAGSSRLRETALNQTGPGKGPASHRWTRAVRAPLGPSIRLIPFIPLRGVINLFCDSASVVKSKSISAIVNCRATGFNGKPLFENPCVEITFSPFSSKKS
jgi:hypothetical protein